MAAMRAEIARKSGRATDSSKPGLATNPAATRGAHSLRREMAAIVEGVDIEDEEGMKSARRRMVRAVLQHEFGSELREYSEWQPMVDTLVSTLEASEAHRTEFRRMVKSLKS